jgi:hypothetical protein
MNTLAIFTTLQMVVVTFLGYLSQRLLYNMCREASNVAAVTK